MEYVILIVMLYGSWFIWANGGESFFEYVSDSKNKIIMILGLLGYVFYFPIAVYLSFMFFATLSN